MLAALRSAPGRSATLSSLAEASSASPEQVAGVLEGLARRGFPVEVSAAVGVRLGPDTPLHPGELRRTLRTRLVGRRVEVYREVDSTQEAAREAAARGAEAGLVVVAEHQRAGRGRLGRRWLSSAGRNLLASVLTFPPEAVPATALTITSAVAVAEAVAQGLALEARIRWPNDVLLGGRKVAGILVEGVRSPEPREGSPGEAGFVIGLGLNVNGRPAEVPGAGSLAEAAGREVDRTTLLVAVLRALDHWYEVLLRGHSDEVEVRWRARSSILGRQVTLEKEGQHYRGRVVDLSVTEGIILELAPGVTRLFTSEHITLLPEPD